MSSSEETAQSGTEVTVLSLSHTSLEGCEERVKILSMLTQTEPQWRREQDKGVTREVRMIMYIMNTYENVMKPSLAD